jgi:hypothetical protein
MMFAVAGDTWKCGGGVGRAHCATPLNVAQIFMGRSDWRGGCGWWGMWGSSGLADLGDW